MFIRERTVYVGLHNTWRNLCEERIVRLEEPDKDGLFRGTGSVELKNYIEDPLVAMTFRVEFSAMLPVKPVPRNIQMVVAW